MGFLSNGQGSQVAHICSPSSQEAGAGLSSFQGQPEQRSEFQAGLDFRVRACLKKAGHFPPPNNHTKQNKMMQARGGMCFSQETIWQHLALQHLSNIR